MTQRSAQAQIDLYEYVDLGGEWFVSDGYSIGMTCWRSSSAGQCLRFSSCDLAIRCLIEIIRARRPTTSSPDQNCVFPRLYLAGRDRRPVFAHAASAAAEVWVWQLAGQTLAHAPQPMQAP